MTLPRPNAANHVPCGFGDIHVGTAGVEKDQPCKEGQHGKRHDQRVEPDETHQKAVESPDQAPGQEVSRIAARGPTLLC